MTSRRIEPGPGQESVWDYPRPPRAEASDEHVVVEFAGRTVADTRSAVRVLETSHPPVYYLPPDDCALDLLVPSPRRTFCEFKGRASYFTLRVGERESPDAAWAYPDPVAAFARLRGYLAFYPSRVDACRVDGERVRSQEGDFYGGWITDRIVGPFKGGAGTWGW
jgi:uncharacterized protein (DUF427 family)